MGPDQSAFGSHIDVRYVRLAPTADALRSLVAQLTAGELSSTVTRRFDFADVPGAYRHLRDGHARGKLVVERP